MSAFLPLNPANNIKKNFFSFLLRNHSKKTGSFSVYDLNQLVETAEQQLFF
jgi:hypothetical protein